MTTTEVSGALYGAGLIVSRDRLYKMADRLFPQAKLRPNERANRRFTDDQVAVLRAAFVLVDLFGVLAERIPDLVVDAGAIEAIMRSELERRTMAVEASLPGLAEAVACVSIQDDPAPSGRVA